MSIFKPNLDKFSSTVFIAPIDEYEMEIISISLSSIDTKQMTEMGEKTVKKWILTFLLSIQNGQSTGTEFKGKPVRHQVWITEETAGEDINNALKVAMAAKGITPGTEAADEEFKSTYGTLDWNVHPETNVLGEGWTSLKGARVTSKLSSKAGKGANAEKLYQNFGMFKPMQ